MAKKRGKAGLTDLEKFCLSGYFHTKNADLAYKLMRGDEAKATDFNLHRMALRWLRNPLAQDYLKALQGAALASSEDTTNRSKDDVISELNTLANQVKEPKERAAILMKLADLQNMKDEPTEQEKEQEQKVNYYLPAHYPTSCKDCLLKLNNVKSLQEAQERAARGETPNFVKSRKRVTLEQSWGKKPPNTQKGT